MSEDLKMVHSQLDKAKISNNVDSVFLSGLRAKQGTHARLMMEAVEHIKQAEMV